MILSEWMPIETAPKDGSHFLVCKFEKFPITGYEIYLISTCYWRVNPQLKNGGYFNSNFSDPQFWMPKPDPPKC